MMALLLHTTSQLGTSGVYQSLPHAAPAPFHLFWASRRLGLGRRRPNVEAPESGPDETDW